MTPSALDVLHDAAHGRFPAADGVVDVMAPTGRLCAVLAFTAHHVVVAPVSREDVIAELPDGDLGAPMSPAFLSWLGDRLGASPGVLDMTFVALPGDPPVEPVPLERTSDHGDHPRVVRAARYRVDPVVYVDSGGAGVVVIGRGFGGRLEMAFEVAPAARGRGLGRRLAAAARTLAPGDEPLYAQVSPGNVASVRAVLAAGYRPIASEVLFAPSHGVP